MKSFVGPLLPLVLFILSCSKQAQKSTDDGSSVPVKKVPDLTIEKSALEYHPETSSWTLNDMLYSGFAVTYYANNNLKEKFGVLDGRKQGKDVRFYPDGRFKSVSDYDNGRLHGEKKLWSPDAGHVLIAHYNYDKGKPHGVQKKWYPTGELFKIIRLNKGKEQGMQQAFRKNGAIYANYEAREGRIFGLKKTKLCYSLENENVQAKKE